MATYKLRGKTVSVHGDGEIFVDGRATGLKQWSSSSTRYSNLSGQEQKDVKGKNLEEALYLRGFLSRGFSFSKFYPRIKSRVFFFADFYIISMFNNLNINILYKLVDSENILERRISIIATLY